MFPGQVPKHAEQLFDLNNVNAVDDMKYSFRLGGNDIIVHEAGFTDTHNSTYLHVPSIDLMLSGDVVYKYVFPYLPRQPEKQGHIPLSNSALDLYNKVLAFHPHRVNPGSLWASADSEKGNQ